MTTQTSRLEGLTTALSYKAPCRVATTANITLSGLQTIDGIPLQEDDRVLVAKQTNAAENGIYLATSSFWSRAKDWNGARDAVKGTRVNITDGTANAGRVFRVTTDNPIVIGVTAVAFASGVAEGVGATALASLDDVDFSTLSSGQVLEYDGTNWVNATLSDITTLAGLSDVTLTSPANGQLLKYDGTKWVNDTVSGGSPGSGDMLAATYDPAGITEQLVGLTSTQTLTNKTFTGLTKMPYNGTENVENVPGKVFADTSTPGFGGAGLSLRGGWSSGNSGDWQMQLQAVAGSDGTDAKVIGGRFVGSVEASVSGGDAQGGNSAGIASIGTTSSLVVGHQIDLTNRGDNTNSTFGLVINGDGNRSVATQNDQAIRVQTVASTPANTGEFVDGLVFTSDTNKNVVSGSVIKTDGVGSATYGIDFPATSFTYGVSLGVPNGTASSVTHGVHVNTGGTTGLKLQGQHTSAAIRIESGNGDGSGGGIWDTGDKNYGVYLNGTYSDYALRTNNRVLIGQNGGDPTDSLIYDFPSINRGLSVKSIDTTNNGNANVHYAAQFECNKQSGNTDASGVGIGAYASGSNVDVWGATCYATAALGTTSVGLVGAEIGVRNFGDAQATFGGGVAISAVVMGFHKAKAHMQLGMNFGTPSATPASPSASYGIVFNHSDGTSNFKNLWTDSFIWTEGYTTSYGPTNGIFFENVGFGTSAIDIINCAGTYGVRVAGTQTIGFEHGGSGASAGFRAIGGGTHAFQVSGSSYTNGLYMVGCNFSGGYEIRTDAFEVLNTGVIGFRNTPLEGSAGAFQGYFRLILNGTVRKVPYYAI